MEKILEFFLGNRKPDYSEKLPAQITILCRGLVGGYLIYLVKGLAKDYASIETNTMRIIVTCAIIIFSICGFVFLYTSLRNYAIGRYVGGKLDLGENPDNALDGKDADDYDDEITEDEALEEYAAEEAHEHEYSAGEENEG